MDTVNTPRITVENPSCGVMPVSQAPNKARLRKLSNVELGAEPLVQHYSVFSVGLCLGYGTLIQCTTVPTEYHVDGAESASYGS